MKILYIHQYYRTPDEGGAIRSWHLTGALRKAGHEVTVLTAHSEGKRLEKTIQGCRVVYLPVAYQQEFSYRRRIQAFLRFVRLGVRFIRKHHEVDLVYASSTPLTVGLLALFAKWRFRIPYIFEVRDLWPEAPIQLGVLKGWLLRSLAQKLEKKFYDGAEKLVALSPDMRHHIEQKTKTPIAVITNMASCPFFASGQETEQAIRLQLGVSKNDFLISYCGAAGPVNDLGQLIEIARKLKRTHLPVKILIAAKGSALPLLKERAQALSLDNLRFLPYGGKEKVRDILQVSQAAYISFQPLPVLGSNSPNKFFDGLAAGKLIITNTQGWIKDLVEAHHCGIYHTPHDPAMLLEQLSVFLKDEALLHTYQENARQLAERYFDVSIQTQKLLKWIDPAYREADANGASVYTLTA